MKSDAIFRVTTALRDRLQLALDGARLPGEVFVGPLDDRDVHAAPLILFLYRIVPNADLRNRERRVASATPPEVDVFTNSLPLDLYYLLTVGTSLGSEESLLRPLGLAMQTLQMRPEITGPGVDHETVRLTPEPLSTEEASRIWTLFPSANYRTSVAYLASPVWIDPPEPEPSAAPVVEDSLLSGSKGREAKE